MIEIIKHLNRIARANDDSFGYRIDIDTRKDVIVLTFIAEEVYDNHSFLCVKINNNDINNFTISEDLIKDACKTWNYKYVD